ncbi:MAG: hypothetical protein LBC74_11090 [Planctomycetaceae bacterium]|jgi:hypothetical protein|nr:hypothetical protein [Planctomycetaceae bacterium]
MKKLLTLTIVIALCLFAVGCDDGSSSTKTTSEESTLVVASYTTVWHDNGTSYSSYVYDDIRYSVTSVPFEGVEYEKASSDFDGPLSSTADINYVGTASIQSDPYLTHWQDGSSTYSSKPFGGVTYRPRTVYNNEEDNYYYSSYYNSYVLYEGTATEGSYSDYELEGDTYVNKNLVDNDGRVSLVSNDD